MSGLVLWIEREDLLTYCVEDIKEIKLEQSILTQGVLACLKGLKEQGCDGPVTVAIEKIEHHLNKQAHK